MSMSRAGTLPGNPMILHTPHRLKEFLNDTPAVAGAIFSRLPRLAQWESRMRAIGHGRRSEMSAADAHARARNAVPCRGLGVDMDDVLALSEGEEVVVTPDDYGRDPVRGHLESLALHEVAVRRSHPAVGTVVVHFPRIGYRVERPQAAG